MTPFNETPEDQQQRAVFIATFSMLAKLASADDTVTKREVELVEQFMTRVLGLDESRRRFAVKIFNDARKSNKDFRSYAEDYHRLVNGKTEVLEWMLDILLRISLADQVFNAPEAQLLQVACDVFGVSEERFDELQKKYGTDTSHYTTLESSPADETDQVTKRYEKLVQQYDPARITALNLPADFVELAERRTKAIKAAYAKVQRDRTKK